MRRSHAARGLFALLLTGGFLAVLLWAVQVPKRHGVPASPLAGFEPR